MGRAAPAPAPGFEPLPAIAPGAAIRIVAPAGPFDAEALRRGVARLGARFDVRVSEGIFEREGYLAGDDRRRLDELWAALEEPETAAILCARGGYGTMRLLDRLPIDRIRRARKLLVGFSDVTALHAAWARAGLRSLHGPMVATLGGASDALFDRFVAALAGELPPPAPVEPWTAGSAEGPLLGGNLALLASLAGTPFLPPLAGAVLFLEDVGERPYRVDRMLTQLRLAGAFAEVAAVVLGRFTACEPGPDGVTVEDVLRDRLADLRVPVAAGLPAGHVEDNLELPLGAEVALDGAKGELVFLGGAVRSPTATDSKQATESP
jgi:muramoyltetrapeptide carboxypeptidase